jgi:hypothetical protein
MRTIFVGLAALLGGIVPAFATAALTCDAED